MLKNYTYIKKKGSTWWTWTRLLEKFTSRLRFVNKFPPSQHSNKICLKNHVGDLLTWTRNWLVVCFSSLPMISKTANPKRKSTSLTIQDWRVQQVDGVTDEKPDDTRCMFLSFAISYTEQFKTLKTKTVEILGGLKVPVKRFIGCGRVLQSGHPLWLITNWIWLLGLKQSRPQ